MLKKHYLYNILFIFVFNFIYSVSDNLYFQNVLQTTEKIAEEERCSDNPSIDVFIITARNVSEKTFYESFLDQQREYLFNKNTEVYILADPDEKGGFIGSTGSLLYALSSFRALYEKTKPLKKDFKDLRIAVIKAGGMARRMIAASVYANKCQMPLPLDKEEGKVAFNTLYYAILNSYVLGQKLKNKNFTGLIVLCSDQLFLTNSDIKEGINYFVDPVSATEAKRSELIIEDVHTREIIDFKRKPSEEVKKTVYNDLGDSSRVWAELTNNYIIAGKSSEFYKMYADYFTGAHQILDLINHSPRGYEIFTSDCILPFFMDKESYLQLRLKEYQTSHKTIEDTIEKRTQFYTNLYQIITKFLCSKIYLCGNEDDTYCEEIVDMIRFYQQGVIPSSDVAKIYKFQNKLYSSIADNAHISNNALIHKSTIFEDVLILDKSVVLNSKLRSGSKIGHDSVIININDTVSIGSQQVLAKVPVVYKDKEAFVLVYVGIDDNPKHKDEAATIFGKSLKNWLKEKNILSCLSNNDEINLFTLPIFPVVFESDMNFKFVSWMTTDELPTDAYKNAKHVSLQEVTSLINYKALGSS